MIPPRVNTVLIQHLHPLLIPTHLRRITTHLERLESFRILRNHDKALHLPEKLSMPSSLPLSYEFSVVLTDRAHLLLPSVHPRYLSSAENRCDSCSTIWGEKPNDEDFIEYPFVMIPCQHIVGSAVSTFLLFLHPSPRNISRKRSRLELCFHTSKPNLLEKC